MATTRTSIGKAASSRKTKNELLDEVSQLKWRASKLNQRATLLQSALDAMDVGFAVFDDSLRLVGWNRRYLELVDLPQETVEAGISVLDVMRHYGRRGYYGPVDPETYAREGFEILQSPERPHRGQLELSDGRLLEIRRFDLSNEGYVSVYSDVTGRRRTEAAVEESEERFRQFSEAASDWFWEMNAELRFTYISKRFEDISGIAREEVYGRSRYEVWRERVPAEDLAGKDHWEQHLATLDAHEPYRGFTVRWRCPNGEIKIFRTSGVPVFDPTGNFLGYRGVGTDISDTMRMQQALAEQSGRLARIETLLQDAVESMPDGFLLWGPDDRLVLANEAFRRGEPSDAPPVNLGVRFADIMEERVRKGIVLHAADDVDSYIKKRLARHREANGEIVEQELGDGRWMELREHRTRIGGIVCFRRDITERKQAEEELVRHRERLEELVEARTRELESAQRELVRSERLAAIGQLTGTVSHELRNPLGTIRSSFSIVRNHLQVSHGPVARAIERIERNIDRCVTIIDELLAYTRVRDMNLEPVAIDSWIADLVRDEEPPGGVGVELRCESAATVPIDQERLRRAIVNLLDNAWQALADAESEPGEGRVRVSTRVANDHVEVEIVDNGPGIPEGILDRIFDPLFSTKSFGVGLGLPLVRQIVEQHGGEIAIDSTPDEGTRVTLSLPVSDDG